MRLSIRPHRRHVRPRRTRHHGHGLRLHQRSDDRPQHDPPLILVGDSLGMVIQGHASTLGGYLDDIIYHTKAVIRGCRAAPRRRRPALHDLRETKEDGAALGGRA